MSELIQKNDNRATIRWKLLTGASALALAGHIASGDVAAAADSDRPQVWIELGGQFEQMNDPWERFAPPFVSHVDTSIFPSLTAAQRPPLSSISADGKITFQPEDSDWIFSAAIRFGRSGGKRNIHAQTYHVSSVEQIISITAPIHIYNESKQPVRSTRLVDSDTRHNEHHRILDFQAGKDVGLGLLGGNGSSVVSAGVRYAQFTSSAKVALGANPEFDVSYKYETRLPSPFPSFFRGHFKFPIWAWHVYAANESISRSFRGIGPSLSWEASAPFAGSKESAELTVDWGINAALLFGRQRVRSHHDTQSTLRSHNWSYQFSEFKTITSIPYHRYGNPARSKSVTVPNVGGFAGLSFRYPNAKISVGYRADFFFGAEDGGIDTRKSANRGFYGPYASISIGLGD